MERESRLAREQTAQLEERMSALMGKIAGKIAELIVSEEEKTRAALKER